MTNRQRMARGSFNSARLRWMRIFCVAIRNQNRAASATFQSAPFLAMHADSCRIRTQGSPTQTERSLVETDKIKMTKHRRLTTVMHAEPIGSFLPRPGRVVGRYLIALVVDDTVISPIAGPQSHTMNRGSSAGSCDISMR